MIASTETLQQRLSQGYREQLRLYDQALDLVTQDTVPPASGHWAGELDGILKAIAAVDAALADDKSAWRQGSHQPCPEFSAVLDKIASRLAMLAQIVQGQVAEYEARKLRLLPEMDAFIQQRRMLNAYGTYGDSHPHAAKGT
jgi:predicted trehalose synthase